MDHQRQMKSKRAIVLKTSGTFSIHPTILESRNSSKERADYIPSNTFILIITREYKDLKPYFVKHFVSNTYVNEATREYLCSLQEINTKTIQEIVNRYDGKYIKRLSLFWMNINKPRIDLNNFIRIGKEANIPSFQLEMGEKDIHAGSITDIYTFEAFKLNSNREERSFGLYDEFLASIYEKASSLSPSFNGNYDIRKSYEY